MAIIGHLIGICFFAALAASGFSTAVQILYWIGVSIMLFVAGANYTNASKCIDLLKQKKRLPKDFEEIVPLIRSTNYDIKCVHVLFSNVVHATIALQLVHAPILAAVIILSACASIVSMQKFKEMNKHVENDPRYK